MSKGNSASCEHCLWWAEDASRCGGICRKNPPALRWVGDVPFSNFPPMASGGLCGSWEVNRAKYKSEPELLPLSRMANYLYVPRSWLRAEAEAGRIPHLKAGKHFLFDKDTVTALFIKRAQTEIEDVRLMPLEQPDDDSRSGA